MRIIPEGAEPLTTGTYTDRMNTETEQTDTGTPLVPEEPGGAYGSHLGSPGSREPVAQTVAPQDGNWQDPSTGRPPTTLGGSPCNPPRVHAQAEAEITTPTDMLTGLGSEGQDSRNPSSSRDTSGDRDSNPGDGLSAAPSQSRDSDDSGRVGSQENLLDFGSSDGSCDDASKPARVPARADSVEITQWNLEHSLKLRDEEGPPAVPEYSTTLPDITEEENRHRSSSHDDDIGRGGETGERFGGKADSVSTSGESSSESGSLGGGLVFPPGGPETSSAVNVDPIPLEAEMDTRPKNKKTPEDSLDRLNFDLTVPPAAARPNPAAASNGLDWWGEAFAETQNITDDFDTLVEQLDENSPDAAATRARPPASKQLQPPHGGTLKPAKSDSSIVDSVKGLAETASSSEQTLGRESSAAGQRKTLLRRLSDQMNLPAIDSRGSAGKGRKSASATNSRSPSPRRRNSPSLNDTNAYVVQAGRLIEKALDFERDKEWEDAFDLFKAAVDVLLNGVQSELGSDIAVERSWTLL